MSDTTAKFQAVISARDETAPVLAHIGAATEALATKMGVLAAEEGEAAAVSPWLRMRGSIEEVHGAVGVLESGVGSLFSRLTTMVPVLGGIGAGFGLTGIFKHAAEIAEKADEFGDTADRIGIAGGKLAQFGYYARMTGTDMTQIIGAFEKFNMVRTEALTGKGEPFDLFKRLHIQIKDAKTGLPRDIGDMLDDIFKAFAANPNRSVQEYIARTLFGKTGGELNEIFNLSADTRKQMMDDMKRMKAAPMTPAQLDAQNRYLDSWRRIGFAVAQVNKSINNELYPALTPVLEQLERFLSANQTVIAEFAGRRVSAFVEMMERVPWLRIGQEIDGAAGSAGKLLNALGGAENVLTAFAAYKALGWAKNLIAGIAAVDAALEGSLLLRVFGPVACWQPFCCRRTRRRLNPKKRR